MHPMWETDPLPRANNAEIMRSLHPSENGYEAREVPSAFASPVP